MEVNQLLYNKASSSDTTSAIAGKSDTSTTYSKSVLNNLLTGKASSSDLTSKPARKADKSTTYAKSDVDVLFTEKASSSIVYGKQNSLIFKDPVKLNPPVQGLPFLSGGNIVPGTALAPR